MWYDCVYLTAGMSSLHGRCARTRAAPRAQPGVHLAGQPSRQQQPGQVGFLKVHSEQMGGRRLRMCCESLHPHFSFHICFCIIIFFNFLMICDYLAKCLICVKLYSSLKPFLTLEMMLLRQTAGIVQADVTTLTHNVRMLCSQASLLLLQR